MGHDEAVSRESLRSLREMAEAFQARRLRASERLRVDNTPGWRFAIIGLNSAIPEYQVSDLATLRIVTEPPGEVELARALKDKSLMSPVGRYSAGIKHELAVGLGLPVSDTLPFDVAW